MSGPPGPLPPTPLPRLGPPAGDRYARHRAIAGFSQDALAAARVAVIGAGAIGNEVVKNLALLGVGRIDLIDLDRVELHNLTRSVLLRPEDVGQPKASCVAARARALDPAVRIDAVVGDLRDVLSVAQLRETAVVIGALDNFEARIRLNQLCRLAGTPWVNAAIDSRHATVETFPFGTAAAADADAPPAPLACACYECGLPASVYGRIAERQSCGGLQRAALAQRVMPTTIITAALAAARATEAALRFVMARPATAGNAPAGPATSAERWLLDSGSGRSTVARLTRMPGCPGCADLPHRARLVRAPDGAAGLIATIRQVLGGRPTADAGPVTDDSLRLADPVLWAVACRQCGETPATRAAELRAARRVSDRIMRCERCGEDAVSVELRDLIGLDELDARLREIIRRDGTTRGLDAHQIIAGDTCIEIPERNHG